MEPVPESLPTRSRLELPAGYAQSDSGTLLPWSHVVDRLEQASNYWLATTRPDGRPHVTPVWGAWVENSFYFTGIPTARWAKNLAERAQISMHLESATEVVIVEGVVEDIPAIADLELVRQIVETWVQKYQSLIPDPENDGMYCLRPHTVRAWSRFPEDLTRWTFPGSG
jgi:hypothetical protein